MVKQPEVQQGFTQDMQHSSTLTQLQWSMFGRAIRMPEKTSEQKSLEFVDIEFNNYWA